MEITQQIESVYRRALLLRQYATESPLQKDLVEKTLQELYFVLEELQVSQEELHAQNQELIATQQSVEVERQRYQSLFELAPNGYLVTDLQGKILQVNHHAATHLFGTRQEHLINKPLLGLIDECDRPQFHAHLAQGRASQAWETTLRPRQGEPVVVAIALTRIQDPWRRQDTLQWSFHDITRRQQLEQQLQQAHDTLETRVAERTAELAQVNHQLQQEIIERQQAEQTIRNQAALIDIASDAIFVQALNHCILFWNKGAERLYGWAAADILGQPASRLYAPAAAPQLALSWAQTLEQGEWQGELEQVTHSGQVILVTSRWTLVRNAAGEPASMLMVNTDITEKKQLENQYYRSQRVESLGSVASNIVHDLNNIFTPILCAAELQLLRQPDPDAQAAWESVIQRVQRGTDLVQQITWFARGTSGQRAPLQLSDLFPNIVKTVQRTVPKSIAIQTTLPSAPLGITLADATQIYQVVMNLCVNACDAMPDGGTLTLAIAHCTITSTNPPPAAGRANATYTPLPRQLGNYVRITVADRGIGMTPALMSQIFAPFFTTKAPGKGTGLGLASVLSIVKNHDGWLELSSQSHQGSQFQVYFPVIPPHFREYFFQGNSIHSATPAPMDLPG